jgi:hypothetical protein
VRRAKLKASPGPQRPVLASGREAVLGKQDDDSEWFPVLDSSAGEKT